MRLVRAVGRAMASATSNSSRPVNRLAQEKSPYLQQHKYNPVEWYPWGQEAFDRAQKDGKAIFLSVGYSTCHWCHVMERESFEDPRVGKIMSDLFVNIKVDREERPDVDKVYMTFIQAISGGGGWPMSVFLTPDLKPITGGTYFPPDTERGAALGGRRSFPSVLRLVPLPDPVKCPVNVKCDAQGRTHDSPPPLKFGPIVKNGAMALAPFVGHLTFYRAFYRVWECPLVYEQWDKQKREVQNQGDLLATALKRATEGEAPEQQVPLAELVSHNCYKHYHDSFDPRFGGFGSAPKFPQPSNLVFLLDLAASPINIGGVSGERSLEMVKTTLARMANGGIYDHVAQGMHRYSTDARWHVPHFEKMLYDQAQLVKVFAVAFSLTKDPLFEKIARGIISYVYRDLSHPAGGCFSAEDADSFPTHGAEHKKEGAFCVWTWDEIQNLLSKEKVDNSGKTVADVFVHYYNCKNTGNTNPMMDPHGELLDQNVLIAYEPLDKTASELDISESDARAAIDKAHAILFEERKKRPEPHLDTKMLAAWNGLMLSGYACAAIALRDAEIVKRAKTCAEFVKQHLTVDGNYSSELLRSCYCPKRGDPSVEQLWAENLQGHMDRLFWDERTAGYFLSRDGDPSILFRMKDDQDGAEPSTNSVAACNLDRLSVLTGSSVHRNRACMVYRSFGQRLTHVSHAVPSMAAALHRRELMKMVVVTGEPSDEVARELVDATRLPYIPGVLAVRTHNAEHLPVARHEAVASAVGPDLAAGTASAHVFAAHLDESQGGDGPIVTYEKRFRDPDRLREFLGKRG